MSAEQQRMLAEQENELFVNMELSGRIFALPGTPNATEAHNEVHLDFMQTQAFQQLSEPVKQAFNQHVQEEIEKNPALAEAAGLMGGPGGGQAEGESGGLAVPPGMPGGPGVDEASAAAAGMVAPVAGGDVTAGAMPMM